MALLVNGERISDEEIAHQRALLFSSEEQAEALAGDPRILRAAEENAVFNAVLRQAAIASGILISPDEVSAELTRLEGSGRRIAATAREREALHLDLQVRRFAEELTRHVRRPSRQEVEAAYLRNRQSYTLPERLHVRHIVVNIDELTTEEMAQSRMAEAQAELHSGHPFGEVADRFSDCKGVGGALGWIARGEMVEEFEEGVFGMPRREVSPIFRTRFGLHLAEVLDRRAAGVQPLEEVRSALTRDMHQRARQQALRSALQRQMAQAEVRVIRANYGGCQ